VLCQTLQSLAEVSLPTGVRPELIVVANACTDDTERVVAEFLPQLPFDGRCVIEKRANLNIARNVAVRHSGHEVLALLDDDVWVEPNWLEGLAEAYEDSGVDMVVGRIELWWKDIERPRWFTPLMDSLLTCKDYGDAPKRLFSPHDAAGANFSFRRKVYEAIGPFVEGLDRTGSKVGLSAGESEFVQRALAAGFRLHYHPRVSVKHWVAPQRGRPEYLDRVSYANAVSRTLIKPRFDIYSISRCIVGNSGLYLVHVLRGFWNSMLGNESETVVSQLQRARARGALYGMWLRLSGRSPMPRRH
jgi:glycosyltransferase involved in cell wall biosynthesis